MLHLICMCLVVAAHHTMLVPHLLFGLTYILGPRHKLVQLIKSDHSLSGSSLAILKDTYTLLWLGRTDQHQVQGVSWAVL